VPIVDEMLDAELAGIRHAFGAVAGSGMGLLCEAVKTRAPVEADAQHQVSSPASDIADTGECFKG